MFSAIKTRLATIAAAALVAALSIGSAASAAGYSFSISGTGSGSLGGAAFTDQGFLFELYTDSANFSRTGRIQQFNPLDKAQVTIGTLGTTVFEIGTRLGYNESNNAVFFSRTTGSDMFDFFLEDTDSLDLTADNDPVKGINVFALNQFRNVATSLGALSFNSSSGVLFGANGGVEKLSIAAPAPAAVPLPMSGLLLLGGLAAPASLRLRRKAA